MIEVTTVFEADTLGYANTRIPALVMTQRGVLLAFCEARRGNGGDWDPIDILMRRSVDGGRTWTAPHTIVGSSSEPTSNSTPIVDRNGAVHFLYQQGYNRAYYLRSDDDGATWSERREITETFEAFHTDYPWRVFAPGPGHGLQLRNGRLLVPVWLSTGGDGERVSGRLPHRPSCVSIIYSDDSGKTWTRGEIVASDSDAVRNPNETVAVQLQDGRVMLNVRNESPGNRRALCFSEDGVTHWSPLQFSESLFEPICMASMIRFSEEPLDRNRILFCNPDSSTQSTSQEPATAVRWGARRRENLSLKLSYDEGLTWPIQKVLEPGIAGYSDLAVDDKGVIYCLYEGGGRNGNMFQNTHLSLARFDLEWLSDGQERPL